ncbi:MAG: magnesium/cobalt transporter CorA [Candidatus Aureabacteria bacterium]|nr:magnesium/cobalt transporter CorA [Candidatus Auribacterota bacterium]
MRIRKRNASDEVHMRITLSVLYYNDADFMEKTLIKPEECREYRSRPGLCWINVDGGIDPEMTKEIGTIFGFHHLVIEDILQGNQRPRIDEFDHYVYVVFNTFSLDKNNQSIIQERICMILGEDHLITFGKKPGDIFESIRNKIRYDHGKIRKAGSDYLAYALMNAVVDHYYIILEKLSEDIDKLEEELLNKPDHKTLHAIHRLRNELLYLSKSVWPLREVLDQVTHEGFPIIKTGTVIYFKDLYDHTIQIREQLEILRDIVSGMMDIYLSSTSNKMNAVMKRLTLITTIFMPLTVLVGIGGMSEWTMVTGSENWRIAYPLFILGMIITGIVTYLYFKWKKWT